jgi:hypothetical protein
MLRNIHLVTLLLFIRFLDGPRIPGSHYFDMNDISTSKELFPDLNPKGLDVMFPPTVGH